MLGVASALTWALRVDKPVFASSPSAKVSEIEEGQEDPYLNDRCRGETGPPQG